MIQKNKVYIFAIILFLLILFAHYHNYCTENKLRHSIFEFFEYMNIFSKDQCFAIFRSEE